ncbi:MAG TPA: biopolymer transporter ExbD [Noviherbaspirillum sp.]|nr:biopolymer transporter ExbD [Noviherbaspirillum sp.]
MAMSGFDGNDEVMSEINMTPFVDVMLVLLIIFMVTIPVINHSVTVDLPHASTSAQKETAKSINVSIDGTGRIFWESQQVDEAVFRARLAEAARQATKPELHLRADRKTPYEQAARVMAASQQAGIARIGFITEPDA